MNSFSFNIVVVECDMGFFKDVLCMWECCYGFLVLDCDSNGECSYLVDQVECLCLIKCLMDMGYWFGKLMILYSEELNVLVLWCLIVWVVIGEV